MAREQELLDWSTCRKGPISFPSRGLSGIHSVMKSKILLFILVVGGAITFNAFYPVRDHLDAAIAWFRALGPLAIVPYMVLFMACAIFFIPITGLILMAGTLYGFWM